LKLAQERMDLEDEFESMAAGDDLEDLAGGFIEVAADYSERHGISYAAWREAGVPRRCFGTPVSGAGCSD
jgi:hypothetical protein